MDLNYKIIDENLEDLDKLAQIIDEAFPDLDKNSISLFVDLQKNGDGYSYACYNDNMLIGFVAFLAFDNYVYLYRYAMDVNLRGQGYGSKVLQNIMYELEKDNPERLIYLDLEYPDTKAKNNDQRKSRIKFYERLGFELTNIVFNFHKDKYTYMVYKNNLTNQDLKNIEKFMIPLAEKYLGR